MVLIIGGAYQGKRDYAKSVFSVTEEEIYDCSGGQIDFSRRCINRVEEFVWDCVQQDRDAADYFRTHREEWQDSVLICQDLFCGVVPVDAAERQWRQETGRLCQYMAGQARQVVRVFCGLGQRLK